jgi:hypothetical protein
MTGSVEDRAALSAVCEEALEALTDARTDYEAARAYLQQFDEDFPEIMADYHAAQGEEKVAALAAQGIEKNPDLSGVSAAGRATLAAAKGEGR